MGLTRTAVRRIRHRPARLALVGVALLVTTLFLAGAVIVRSSLTESIGDGAATVSAEADLVVTPRGTGEVLSEGQVDRLRAIAGVVDVAVEATGPVVLGGAGRDRRALVGTDTAGPLSQARIVEGSAPRAADEVAVTRRTADRSALTVGARVVLHPTATAVEATVSAIVAAPAPWGSAILTTPANAAAWLGATGWQRAVLSAEDPDATAAAIRAAGFEVTSAPALRESEVEQALGPVTAVFTLVLAFIAVALLAAAVIVHTTFRVLLTRDRGRVALLRCAGARPAQVIGSVLVEAALAGLVAGVLGAAAAVLVCLLVVGDLTVPWVSLALCVGVAVVLAVTAGAPAALAAARVPPVAAMGSATAGETPSPLGTGRRLLAALALLAAAGLGLVAYTADNDPEPAILAAVGSAVALFVVVLATGPALLRLGMAVLRLPARVGGIDATLALGNVLRVPRRSAACAAVAMLGVAMVGAVLVVLSSLEQGAQTRIADRHPADAVVAISLAERPRGLSPAVADALRALPEVGTVTPVTRVEGTVANGLDTTPGHLRSRTLDGLGPGGVALSEPRAADLGATVGTPVTITVEGNTFRAPVTMVYPPKGDLGDVVLHPSDMATLAPTAPISTLVLDAAPGVDPATLRTPVDAAVPADPSITLRFTAEERADEEAAFEKMLAAGLGLGGLTVLVSTVGLAVTLSLSVLERTRESGVLRALGLRGARLRSILAWEAALLTSHAVVPGLLIGVGYGALTLRAFPRFDVVVPYGPLVLVVLGALVLAHAASVLPARRTARTSPMRALAAT